MRAARRSALSPPLACAVARRGGCHSARAVARPQRATAEGGGFSLGTDSRARGVQKPRTAGCSSGLQQPTSAGSGGSATYATGECQRAPPLGCVPGGVARRKGQQGVQKGRRADRAPIPPVRKYWQGLGPSSVARPQRSAISPHLRGGEGFVEGFSRMTGLKNP